MVKLKGQKAINKIVSHLDGVRDAVHDEAEDIAARAEVRMSGHHRTGAAHIDIMQGRVDSYVSLVDEHAMSIEFGHDNVRTGRYTPGIYVITGAAGLI